MQAAIDYLRRKEWSMGHGQCPECSGGKPGHWEGEPICEKFPGFYDGFEGHKKECEFAKALESLGRVVAYKEKGMV